MNNNMKISYKNRYYLEVLFKNLSIIICIMLSLVFHAMGYFQKDILGRRGVSFEVAVICILAAIPFVFLIIILFKEKNVDIILENEIVKYYVSGRLKFSFYIKDVYSVVNNKNSWNVRILDTNYREYILEYGPEALGDIRKLVRYIRDNISANSVDTRNDEIIIKACSKYDNNKRNWIMSTFIVIAFLVFATTTFKFSEIVSALLGIVVGAISMFSWGGWGKYTPIYKDMDVVIRKIHMDDYSKTVDSRFSKKDDGDSRCLNFIIGEDNYGIVKYGSISNVCYKDNDEELIISLKYNKSGAYAKFNLAGYSTSEIEKICDYIKNWR